MSENNLNFPSSSLEQERRQERFNLIEVGQTASYRAPEENESSHGYTVTEKHPDTLEISISKEMGSATFGVTTSVDNITDSYFPIKSE